MPMINRIYLVIQTLINKDQNGYISPDEFNIIAGNIQNRILRGYFEDENRDKVKENRGLTNRGYSNLSFNERQRIQQFAEIATLTYNGGDSSFALPTDLYFIEDKGITTSNGNVIEEVQRTNLAYLNKSSLSAPSEVYPVYERYSNKIVVSPSSIVSGVTCRYIRTPNPPKWTFIVLGDGTPLFNPSANDFQDFELHESEFSNIAVMMLSELGLSIRESEVVQVAEALKNQQNIKDNS